MTHWRGDHVYHASARACILGPTVVMSVYIKKFGCAVEGRWSIAGASPARELVRSTRVAIEATAEATKPLELPSRRSLWRLGNLADRNVSERRAGLETMLRNSRPVSNSGKAEVDGTGRANSFHRPGRGSGDGMQVKGIIRNTGSHSVDRGRDQLATRESQARQPWGGGEASRY